MKKKSKIILIALLCIVGTCMHFVCDLIPSGPVRTAFSLIFPANETSWEHMKMIWYPFFTAGIVLLAKEKEKGYISGMVIAGITAILVQLGAFALYQSFAGSSILMLDIVFYLADMIFCAMLGLLIALRPWARKSWGLWLAAAILVTAGIIYLTFCPGSGYVFLDDRDLIALGL